MDHACRDGDQVWRAGGVRGRSASELKGYTGRALREAAAGTIAPVIGQTFALDEAGSAHAAIESRTVFGKTLLTMT